jgi:putative ABC transport system permease protein
MILFNLKLAIRNLLKNKVYSFLIIGGFSIGFAAFVLIGLYYYSEHNMNKGFVQHEQIYRLYNETANSYNLDYELYPVLAESFPEIDQACPMAYSNVMEFSVKDEQENTNTRIKNLISTNNTFFSVFKPQVIASLSSSPFSGNESAVITESLARRLYGNDNAIGRIINIHQIFTATITAVIKDLPENSTFKAEILLNSDNEKFRFFQSCNNGICKYLTHHFILVREDVDVKKFTERINETIGSHGIETDSLVLQNLAGIYLSPLTAEDMHLKGNSRMLVIFLSIAILILVLSSINYLNYIISVQYAKLKVTGINKTVGAGQKHLFSYIITEVGMGILFSLIISFLIVLLLLPYSETLFGKGLRFFDPNTVKLIPLFFIVIFTVIVVNSLAPVYLLSRFNITDFLSGFGKRKGKQTGKQAMLTFQLTASIALIGIVLVVFKQLSFVKNYDLGFDKGMLVRIDLPFNNPNLNALKQEMDKRSIVNGSTLSFGCPGMINSTMGSNSGEKSFTLDCIYIGDDYLKIMDIELLEGRNLLESDRGKACLLNEEAVKQYGWENLEGKKFNNGREGGYEVVGVTKDFHVKSLHENVSPTALIYDTKKGQYNMLSVRLSAGKIRQQMEQIGQIWKQVIPDEAMNLTFYEDQFQAMYEKEAKLAKSITFFSIIAIVLTCMGILAQIYIISLNRTKEIGIRKVNGARISEILALLNRDFVKWVAIAFVIATPIAYYTMNKWLENFAYKTELSWWIFALAGLLALGIALLTVSWQSWKAATRNPVEALRYE